jgi:hypothetical protein
MSGDKAIRIHAVIIIHEGVAAPKGGRGDRPVRTPTRTPHVTCEGIRFSLLDQQNQKRLLIMRKFYSGLF